ncbi:hypothetical protein CEXT_771321 [Caerostris extrusa]|uniref:Uncharacterized protein n=1 Tax=Caerostris extrusa TaxID=172846 RepID=A0AAV4SRM0_CAEEX|nr:hypothetical protein CEXT_771321 [Caerostris extrusa]
MKQPFRQHKVGCTDRAHRSATLNRGHKYFCPPWVHEHIIILKAAAAQQQYPEICEAESPARWGYESLANNVSSFSPHLAGWTSLCSTSYCQEGESGASLTRALLNDGEQNLFPTAAIVCCQKEISLSGELPEFSVVGNTMNFLFH